MEFFGEENSQSKEPKAPDILFLGQASYQTAHPPLGNGYDIIFW